MHEAQCGCVAQFSLCSTSCVGPSGELLVENIADKHAGGGAWVGRPAEYLLWDCFSSHMMKSKNKRHRTCRTCDSPGRRRFINHLIN